MNPFEKINNSTEAENAPINTLLKRPAPAEIIEKISEPDKEVEFTKYPRENLINVSASRYPGFVTSDVKKIEREVATHAGRAYMEVHTHPYVEGQKYPKFFNAYPSGADLFYLIKTKDMKSLTVAQTDSATGEVLGYLVLMKTKNTPPAPEDRDDLQNALYALHAEKTREKDPIKLDLLHDDIVKRQEESEQKWNSLFEDRDIYNKETGNPEISKDDLRKVLNTFTDKYHLAYRFVAVGEKEMYRN